MSRLPADGRPPLAADRRQTEPSAGRPARPAGDAMAGHRRVRHSRLALPPAARLLVFLVCLLPSAVCLPACGVYSFSGTSLPATLRTVALPPAERQATGGPPTLDAVVTEALVSRFVDRSPLSLEPDEAAADAVVRVTIQGYAIAPAAVTDDNQAALNRLTLSVRVVMTEREAAQPRLDRVFSATEDFAPADGLAGEAAAAEAAAEQIARDAFAAAASDW